MTVVEFCSGMGGATHGLISAGLRVEATYDLWPVAVKAHLEWHPDVPCEMRDVSQISPEELRGRAVWASLPCQPYSIANQVRRWRDHPHYYALRHFARQVQHARVAVIENVAGLAWTREGKAELEELRDECRLLGLACSVQVISCLDHGMRTDGKRTIVIISTDGHSGETIVPTTDRATITSNRPLASDGKGAARHSSRQRPLASAGKGRLGQSAVNTTLYTVEQAAELQGVPVPTAAKTNQLRLIGNAVPPKIAEAIAQQVIVPRLSCRPEVYRYIVRARAVGSAPGFRRLSAVAAAEAARGAEEKEQVKALVADMVMQQLQRLGVSAGAEGVDGLEPAHAAYL